MAPAQVIKYGEDVDNPFEAGDRVVLNYADPTQAAQLFSIEDRMYTVKVAFNRSIRLVENGATFHFSHWRLAAPRETSIVIDRAEVARRYDANPSFGVF